MNDNGGSPDCRITLGNKEGREGTEESRIPFSLNAADVIVVGSSLHVVVLLRGPTLGANLI